MDEPQQPVGSLYPFGYGLSYTTFELKNLRLEKESISTNEPVKVFIDVTNTGSRRAMRWCNCISATN